MSRYKELTLLHSNDMHGDFLAEHIDESLVGGVSMLSGYVDQVRKEQKNTLYCIAGDMFRGSVIDAEFKGVSTIEIMNAISPDVVTLGNHEIDYGMAHLLFLEKCARFPIINANLFIKTNHSRLFQPYLIKEIDGMKVLFIGIITETVLRSTRNEENVGTLVDVYEAAEEVGRICNAYKTTDVDLTVLLTHIGYEQDCQLAAKLKKEWGVDIIVGGHSHTFLDQPAIINDVIIVQAGTGTDLIGRFDLVVDTELNCVASYQWQCIEINESRCPRDTAVEQLISSYKETTDKKYGRVITRLKRTLTHPIRYRQTEMGSLFTDALTKYKALDVMFLASGSIRTDSIGPLIQYSDLMTAFPYDGPIIMMEASGAQLKEMIQYMFRDAVLENKESGYFQLPGQFCVEYDQSQKKFIRLDYDGKPLDEERYYRIGMLKYHYQNFKNYFGFPKEDLEKTNSAAVIATSARDILEEYLTSFGEKDVDHEGRITIINKEQN